MTRTFKLYCNEDVVREIHQGIQKNVPRKFYTVVCEEVSFDRWGLTITDIVPVIKSITREELDQLLDAITGPAEL